MRTEPPRAPGGCCSSPRKSTVRSPSPPIWPAARPGRLARARDFLGGAEGGAAASPGGAWTAAVAEARAELLLAEGDGRAAGEALWRAAEGYAAAGQLRSERRARAALAQVTRAQVNA